MNEYMIRCSVPIVSFDFWEDALRETRQYKNKETFGYGIKVNTIDYPLLEDLRLHIPLKPYFFFLVSNRKRREFPIHVDGIPNNHNAASINWPIKNCDIRSPTKWYTPTAEVRWKDIDNSFFMDNPSDTTLVHSEAMESVYKLPYLFRSDVLHEGFCNITDNRSRIIVKWELEYDSWQTACKEFQNRNYI